jgi:UMF1 family MFS transporter
VTDSQTGSIWRREVIGWSLYDFANTIYSMNILSRYLKPYIVEDLGHPDHYFDVPFSLSMLAAGVLLPGLGAMSDHSTKKKIFLFLFTLTCCSAVGLMALVPAWAIFVTLGLFMVANFSYEAGQPFYNALLYSVAEGKQARLVSGVGVAWGYVGSVVGLVLVMPFVTGAIFNWDVSWMEGGGKTASFVPTAFLFLLFAIPVFLWVRERPPAVTTRPSLRQAYGEVWEAIRQTRKYPGVVRFLIADYFVEDAAATVILNIGLYCSLVLGLPDAEITTFLIISTITAVVGSFVIGYLAKAWSLRKLLTGVMSGWAVVLVLFVMTDTMAVIWVLGFVVGVLLGGLWTTTRPFLAELVPHEELGKFFGLFSLSGRAAAIAGPLLWTSMVYLFQPHRPAGKILGEWLRLDSEALSKLPYKVAVLSLAFMVLIGLIVFRGIPRTENRVDG